MNKRASKIMLMVIAMLYVFMGASSVAMAQEEEASGFTTGLFDARGAAAFGAAIGVGLVIIGGARGISRIGASAGSPSRSTVFLPVQATGCGP